MSKRIIIVEDEALIAAEIKSILKSLGYEVVGHAMNGDKALDLFANVETDIFLLDISIKGTLNGIDLAKIIRQKYKLPFVFLTSFSDKITLEKVKDTMPYGYIVKPFNENDIKVNVELALHKFEAEQDKLLFSKAYITKKLDIELTDREFEILAAFKKGLTYKETAAELFISINTVKTYQKRLYQLFGVATKFELLQKVG